MQRRLKKKSTKVKSALDVPVTGEKIAKEKKKKVSKKRKELKTKKGIAEILGKKSVKEEKLTNQRKVNE